MIKFIKDIKNIGFENACHRLPEFIGFPIYLIFVMSMAIFVMGVSLALIVPPLYWLFHVWGKLWGIPL